jgi:hypothetical protein
MPASAEGGLRGNDTIQPVKSQRCSLELTAVPERR